MSLSARWFQNGEKTAWAKITAISDAVVGATYPEMGKVLSKAYAKVIIFLYRDTVHRVVQAKDLVNCTLMKTDLEQ